MKCPNCGLINPDSAQICDCGYKFNLYERKLDKLENLIDEIQQIDISPKMKIQIKKMIGAHGLSVEVHF